MIALDEITLRRDDFRPGWRVLGADKQLWHVPPIDLPTAMTLRCLRAYMGLIDLRPDMPIRWFSERAAALEILRVNYDIPDDAVDAILGDPFSPPDEPDDPNRIVAYAVLEAVVRTLMDSDVFVLMALKTPPLVN